MSGGFMYILECYDGSYSVGSTVDLIRRFEEHQNGVGANHTKKRLPVTLVYCEEYRNVAHAFYREKQVQGWRREKKQALIDGQYKQLPFLAIAYRDLKSLASRASANLNSVPQQKSDSTQSELNKK